MTGQKLTELCHAAKRLSMRGIQHKARGNRRMAMWATGLIGPIALAGCVTVNAPNDAIVIELNINITQEVIYRLAEDAGNTIEENADIF